MWNLTDSLLGNNDTVALQGAMLPPTLFATVAGVTVCFSHHIDQARWSQTFVTFLVLKDNVC
jgi:integral membrane sensor domain MASE1